MNLKVRHARFPIFPGAKPDIERIDAIWAECLASYGGPWLFGDKPTVADAMFAPVAERFLTYAVPVSATTAAYCQTINGWPLMREWIDEPRTEPVQVEELDIEF